MNIENVGLFHSELVACGLSISGADSSGNVHVLSRPSVPLIDGEPDPNWTDPTDSIIEAVKNAHGQLLSSDECLALKSTVGDEIFNSYVEARNEPIRNKRAEKFRTVADPLILSSIESALAGSTPTEGKYQVTLPEESVTDWISIKNQIREELPYSS